MEYHTVVIVDLLRLREAHVHQHAAIERVLIGLELDKGSRVQIIFKVP